MNVANMRRGKGEYKIRPYRTPFCVGAILVIALCDASLSVTMPRSISRYQEHRLAHVLENAS
jgi:hypothetical protein